MSPILLATQESMAFIAGSYSGTAVTIGLVCLQYRHCVQGITSQTRHRVCGAGWL